MGALRKAIDNNDLNAVRKILAKGSVNIDFDGNPDPPLVWAAFTGRFEIVKQLIYAGANIDNTAEWKATSLMLAVREGHVGIAKFLIEEGADISLIDNKGNTALIYANQKCSYEIAVLIETSMSIKKPWKKLKGEKIAHITFYPEISKKITEIFNFEARERQTISENLKTKSESITCQKFEDISDESLIAGFEAYQKNGGALKKEFVFHRRKSMSKKPCLVKSAQKKNMN